MYVHLILCHTFYFLTAISSCPALNDPDNGNVYIISNGQNAIFTCKSGFTVIGNPFLVCLNGVWNSPPPKCHAT